MTDSAAPLTVSVENPRFRHPSVELAPGDEFEFGRDVGGAGRISERSPVSRHHGRIIVTDHGFSIVTTGSQIGVTVADRTTPSKLVVPRGVGPVPVPFRNCSIIVDLRDHRDYLDVTVHDSELADRWAESWGPQMRERWFADQKRAAPLTADPFEDSPVRWRKRNGAPYAWFRTLIALCEPALGGAPAGTLSNEQLCARLYLSKSVVERHLTQIYDAFDMDEDNRDRELVVLRAVELGVVTRADADGL